MATPVNYQAINDAESGANPPVPWADGTLDCFSDCEVCLWGCFPCGCYQSLFAWNARDAGTEDFHPALFRVLGLTIVVPNLLGFAASAAPSLAPAVQPLSTANQLLFAWYGMTHRQKMRRRHNIKGTDSGLCNCFACLCEGDEEKIEDFCCYLCCAPVSKLSPTPVMFSPLVALQSLTFLPLFAVRDVPGDEAHEAVGYHDAVAAKVPVRHGQARGGYLSGTGGADDGSIAKVRRASGINLPEVSIAACAVITSRPVSSYSIFVYVIPSAPITCRTCPPCRRTAGPGAPPSTSRATFCSSSSRCTRAGSRVRLCSWCPSTDSCPCPPPAA